MAIGLGYSKISTSGLTFCFDTGDTNLSYLGRPTTNISAGISLGNYNNVGSDVTTSLTQTSETYKGAPIWKQILTPITASGVSYLSNANNPGLGVVTGGGGGTANRYTGHSIFFKPTTPMAGCPCFTHYSNIGGWQSSCDYDILDDGWYRARVIWYDTTTRSDGKYWAINPASATLNVPITIYWAGPFKEDLNSTTVSQYTNGSRTNTTSLFDLTKTKSIDLSNVTYTSTANITFDGNSHINVGSLGSTSDFTVELIFKSNSVSNYRNPIDCNWLIFNGGASGYSNIGPRLEQNSSGGADWVVGDASGSYTGLSAAATSSLNTSNFYHMILTKSGTNFISYLNGRQVATLSYSSWVGSMGNLNIGRGFSTSSERWFSGTIPTVKIYNRALNLTEIAQNYNHYKTRFNLP